MPFAAIFINNPNLSERERWLIAVSWQPSAVGQRQKTENRRRCLLIALDISGEGFAAVVRKKVRR